MENNDANEVDRVAALEKMIAELQARLDDQAAESTALKERMDVVPGKGIPQRPNPNCIRYKLENGRIISKEFPPKIARIKEGEGWVDTPAKLEGHKPVEPTRTVGELVEGKIVEY